MKRIKVLVFCLFVFLNFSILADEIIQDRFGNYFLMKKDGTFKKLPPPKPGNTYVIKQKTKNLKKKDLKIIKKVKKKARVRTNIGFR